MKSRVHNHLGIILIILRFDYVPSKTDKRGGFYEK